VLVGASLQWAPVFSGRESLVGARLQWMPVFSGSQASVGASLQWEPVFSGSQSSVGASLQWEPVLVGACASECQFPGGCQSSVRASEQFSFNRREIVREEERLTEECLGTN
jgi:hypothetical protein